MDRALRTRREGEPGGGLTVRDVVLRSAVAIATWCASPAIAGPWSPYGPVGVPANVATHPILAGRAMLVAADAGPDVEFRTMTTWFTADAGAHWVGNAWRGAIGQPVLAGSPPVAWLVRNTDILRSTDEGRSWFPVDLPPGLDYPQAIAVNPGNPDEAVVTTSGAVWVTPDGGVSWDGEEQPGTVDSLAVDWSTRRAYVVAAQRVRVKSLSEPGTWSDLPGHAKRVFAARGIVLYQGYDGQLQRSVDGGAFSPVALQLGALDVLSVAFASTGLRVFAVDGAGTRVIRSDDGGATWTTASASVGRTVAIDAANPDRLYLSGGESVVESTDAGASFHELSRANGAPGLPRILALDASNPQRRWATSAVEYQRTFLQSTDAGITWSPAPGFRRLVGASRVRTNTLFGAAGTVFDEELAVSTDGGATWTPKVMLSPAVTSIMGPIGYGSVPGQVLVVEQGRPGVTPQPVPRVHVSSDDGENFVARAAPPIQVAAIAAAPSVVYAGGHAGNNGPQLWRSSDLGASWQPVATFASPFVPTDGNDILALASDPAAPNRIYAGLALPPFLMRSDDGGATWTRATVGLGSGAVTSIVVDPATPAIVYAAQFSSGVFRSTDRGAAWLALDEGLRDPSVRQLVIDPARPARLHVATDSGFYEVDLASGVPAGHRRAIEFYHAGFDHYVITADDDEIAGLDAGVFPGWVRTGEGFRVAEPAAPGNQPACRFFGVGFGAISSHFFTPYPGECDDVKADPNWQYEKIAFGLALPASATHGCPPDTRPLYRSWNVNQGGAPNHRYNTDLYSILDTVQRQGWILEGEAETFVFACVPA